MITNTEEQIEEAEIRQEIFNLEKDIEWWKEETEECKILIKERRKTIKQLKRKLHQLYKNEERQND